MFVEEGLKNNKLKYFKELSQHALSFGKGKSFPTKWCDQEHANSYGCNVI